MPSGMYLRLPDREKQALYDCADEQFRDPRDQVALFVREGLRRDGYLPAPDPREPHREPAEAER